MARDGTKTGGRKAGTPNKATQAAREAIGAFVDGNAHRLQEWLDRVADGVKDEDGSYVVKPDPERAFGLFQSVIEYHVPKLARTEMSGPDGGPVNVVGTFNVNFRSKRD
jgi:hypothetical protein